MVKPNYPFAKHQRELAKKRKQEEKDARKRSARADPPPTEPAPTSVPEPVAIAPPAGPRIHQRKTQKEDGAQ